MYVGMTRAIEQLYMIYPEDRRFEQRTRAGDNRCPASTDDGAHPASCFLYEANLCLSDSLGGRILKPQPETEPIQAENISTIRQYLKAINTEIPVQKNTVRPIPKRKKNPSRLSKKMKTMMRRI